MLKKSMFLVSFSLIAGAMQIPVVYETEVYTLTFQKSSLQKSLTEALLENASFQKENTFTSGELVVIRSGLLSVFNFSSKISSKIVRLTDVAAPEHTFEIVDKTDTEGNPQVIRKITVRDPEMLGKISQSLAKSLKTIHQ